jgi:Na+/H+ antiporter NhaD/arsenite permease-like protein
LELNYTHTLTDVVVLFPFHVPIPIPAGLYKFIRNALASLRILPPGEPKSSVTFWFPVNMVTGPLIGDLFLLAIGAIGRREVTEGTLGANNISPLDIMLFFISLAYIAISIDASGAIRFMSLKVLQWGGEKGHRLFFYLYAFWFALTSFVGNDPVILSGTPFLAYMIRVSRNIEHGRAWLFSQFACANIASAILVSSNPTNLVLAGAFQIRFIDYTANMIVPVILTGVILFPFLLHIVFNSESLVPRSIEIHQFDGPLGDPVNPNIPNAQATVQSEEESVFNPFLDRKSAIFGSVVMAATLIAVLSLNAATAGKEHIPVYYIALPGAAVMLLWDFAMGWIHRKETREIARKGREEIERLRLEQAERDAVLEGEKVNKSDVPRPDASGSMTMDSSKEVTEPPKPTENISEDEKTIGPSAGTSPMLAPPEKTTTPEAAPGNASSEPQLPPPEQPQEPEKQTQTSQPTPTTLVSLSKGLLLWSEETFPTAMAVLTHLPYALVPFAFCMFVLVQALVTKGWVPIFARGWDAWVRKTGPIGAIGGMGFLSVILCNVCSPSQYT